MSERILKLLSQETNLTTAASTFSGAHLLRLRNAGAVSYSIMVKESGNITGSVTIYPSEVLYVYKKTVETIESTATNSDVRVVAIAFGD